MVLVGLNDRLHPSVLWHCRLCHLTCKNLLSTAKRLAVRTILKWSIMCRLLCYCLYTYPWQVHLLVRDVSCSSHLSPCHYYRVQCNSSTCICKEPMVCRFRGAGDVVHRFLEAEPALGKGERGPCPGPRTCVGPALGSHCVTRQLFRHLHFMWERERRNFENLKFCSSRVTYCEREDVQVLRYVASQNIRRSYIWYTVDTGTDTVAEMTSSRAADRVGWNLLFTVWLNDCPVSIISNGGMGKICGFLWTRKIQKAFNFRGASPPDSLPGALPPGPPL